MEEADEPRQKRNAAWTCSVVLVGLLVLYPLSIGPACVIGLRTGTIGLVAAVYAPVSLLPLNGQHLCSRYINWWLEITGTERTQ